MLATDSKQLCGGGHRCRHQQVTTDARTKQATKKKGAPSWLATPRPDDLNSTLWGGSGVSIRWLMLS
jgi:hypothetical protein